MDQCTDFFHQMADFRGGRLDDTEQQGLFAHLAVCHRCREMLDFHDDLGSAGTHFDEPVEPFLAEVRKQVIDEIQLSDHGTHDGVPPVVELRRDRRWLAAAAAVILALAAGFSAGRFGGEQAQVSEGELLVAALDRTATHHARLADVENSDSVISNVVVRPLENERVTMSFDITRHLEIERAGNDPLVNEVLVHAMLDQSSLGSRLKAVSLAGGASNGKVEEALVFAMVNDPALPVRLRALEVLADAPGGDAVEQGLLRVLRHDDSMQMRLLAVDLLTRGSGAQTAIVKELLEEKTNLDPAVANRLARITTS